MGSVLFLRVEAGDGLYDHEGWLSWEDPECGRDDCGTWGTGHGWERPSVRAACECGWRGPRLPWRGGHPEGDQEDALLAAWYVHADAYRRDLELAAADAPLKRAAPG